jgi:hypothetical protein
MNVKFLYDQRSKSFWKILIHTCNFHHKTLEYIRFLKIKLLVYLDTIVFFKLCKMKWFQLKLKLMNTNLFQDSGINNVTILIYIKPILWNYVVVLTLAILKSTNSLKYLLSFPNFHRFKIHSSLSVSKIE